MSTDFYDGIQVSSTPLPPFIDDFVSERSESVCSLPRRQVKKWTPQELALIANKQYYAIPEVVKQKEPSCVVSKNEVLNCDDEYDDQDMLSLPGLLSFDMEMCDIDDSDRSAIDIGFNQLDEESDSESDESCENNVYEIMKSLSNLHQLETTIDSRSTDEDKYTNLQFEDSDDELNNCAYAIEDHPPNNDELNAVKTETANQNKTLKDSGNDTTIIDPLQFITTLCLDDDFFLAKFPAVIRDPSIQLSLQEVPNSGSFEIHISEVYSPVHFWFQFTQEV